MKKNWKRMLSLLLTVCMIAGLLVLPAAAYDSKDEALDALNAAIADAETAIKAVAVSEDGAEVDPAEKWVTQGAVDTYQAAIDVAKGVASEAANDEEVGQEQVEAALADLVTATDAFETAKQAGTKEEGGENDPTRTVTFVGGYFSVEEIKQGETELELDDGKYTANTTADITFKVTADANYEITKVEQGETELEPADGVYTISAGTDDVIVTITAESESPATEYNVTVTAGENGTATASVDKAAAGTEVTLTVTPATGYVVDQITSDDVTVTDNKFTMPDKDVTIAVTFKAEEITPPDTPVDLSTKTVSLDKTAPVVGDTLTATVSDDIPAADVDFIWTVDGAVVTDNKTATYTVAADDMDKVIKVKAQAKADSTTYESATPEVSTGPVVGKTMTLTVKNVDTVYDGQSYNISVTGVPEGAKVEFSPDGAAWSMLPTVYTGVIDTIVYYRVTAEGYEPAEGSGTIIIRKAAAPNIKIQASKSQVAAIGGDVTFTVTGVPAGTAAPTATCSQGDEVTLTPDGDTYTCTKTFVALAEGQTEDVVHTVTLSWSDSNYEGFTQAPKAVVTQKGHGAVVAEPATDLKFAEASTAKLAPLGIAFTPVSGGNNKLVYTIDEAALLAAWGTEAGKAVLQGSGVFNAELNRAYVCVMFKLPADVASDWTVTQTVGGETGTPCLLDGGHTFDVFTVGEDKYLGDWYSIAEINGETLTVLPAIAWDNITYEFKNASNETKHIVEINMERKVTAAPVKHTVTVISGTANKAEAAEGESVTVTAEAAPTGKVFDKWTTSDLTLTEADAAKAELTFTMPAKNVTLTATYKDVGGEDPGPSGEDFDVVPGNLGQIDENSSLPANGLAEGYTATAVSDGEGAVTVTLKAATLFKHKNAQGVEGFWIGFGMPIEGETGTGAYTYCLVDNGVDGSPIASVPGRVQTVAGKNYNTVYFNLEAADAGKTVTVVIKQTKLGDPAVDTVYTVNITVDALTDPLAKALKDADEIKKATKISETGSDVAQSEKWVTQTVMDALTAAIETAQTVADQADATTAEKIAAAAALNEAVKTFEAARKDGTKAGNNRPTGGGSGVGATSGAGKREELADGTKRSTETERDGTVIVTDVKPDGSKIVTTTTPAGEVTTAVTLGKDVKSVKLSVPVEGANTGTVAVVVKADGTEELIRGTAVVDGNVIFQVNENATVKLVNRAKRFVDTAGHWGKSMVDFVSARELFNGVDATHFAPDAAMTRGMMATVLFRLDGENAVSKSGGFGDVKVSDWYSKAVNWAVEKNIVNGYTDGTFAPGRPITREELAVMIYRYANAAGLVAEANTILTYADAENVSDWAKEAVSWLTTHGILNGRLGNRFDPRGNATRAEVSAVLARYVALVNG